MYFTPATRKPPLWIFLGSDLSEYEAMTPSISAGETWPHRQSSNLAPGFSANATSRAVPEALSGWVGHMDGRGRKCRRTVKPGVVAHTLVP